jgi:hypothetical protein
MSNAQFHPSVPKGKNLVIDATVLAHQLDEIGIVGGKISSNPVTRWSFIFPLRNFQIQKNAAHVRNISVCPLFGRVVSCSHQMLECVTKLSSTKGTERSGFTITLESQ